MTRKFGFEMAREGFNTSPLDKREDLVEGARVRLQDGHSSTGIDVAKLDPNGPFVIKRVFVGSWGHWSDPVVSVFVERYEEPEEEHDDTRD